MFDERVGTSLFPDADGVVELIRRFGIFGLGGSDGCLCCHFQVRGYEVHVSCRKSEHTVRVFSGYLGEPIRHAFPIAAEVLRCIGDCYSEGYRVRFCDYSYDNKNGHWEAKNWVKEQACCYCGALGRSEDAYLCEKCRLDERIRDQFDDSGWPAMDPRKPADVRG